MYIASIDVYDDNAAVIELERNAAWTKLKCPHNPCNVSTHTLLGFVAGVHPVLVRGATNSVTLLVAVEDNVSLVFNELAGVVVSPEGLKSGLIRGNVVVANESLQVLSRLRAMVEGHFWEELFANEHLCTSTLYN